MTDCKMLHIINPQFFKWVIQWISPDQYIAHAYPTQDGANNVPLKSFVDIIGDLRDLKPGFGGNNSISDIISSFNFGNYEDTFLYLSLESEFVDSPETCDEYAQFIESDTVYREVRYLGSMNRFDRYSLNEEGEMDYIIAQKCDGYIQPIQKRCVYDVLKGSIVSLKNMNSVIYTHLTAGMILPKIHSLDKGIGPFAKWHEYSLIWKEDKHTPNGNMFLFIDPLEQVTTYKDNQSDVWKRATRKKPLFPDPWKD